MVPWLRRIGGIEAVIALFFVVLIALAPIAAKGSTPNPHPGLSVIVGNDRGGLLTDRIAQLRVLLAQQRRVEIRGEICLSTCTMLLGLPNVCVSPETSFGFHGPSYSGRPLAPELFDRASRIIASFTRRICGIGIWKPRGTGLMIWLRRAGGI